MSTSTRSIDFHVARMPPKARWFGVRLISAREGSIGVGVAEIVYSLGAYQPPVPADRVEPWLSSSE
jgi:hypothetical protein